VEGEQFTAQVIAQVEGLEEWEVLNTLSQNLESHHRLVRGLEEIRIGGQSVSRYQFAHALFQVYVYNTLSPGERRLLHGEIALALEDLYANQTAQVAVILAHHYMEGGWTEKALMYLLHAGEQARLAYANTEAIVHYQRALTLLDENSTDPSWKKYRMQALQGLGVVYFGMGKNAEAEAPLREAIELGKEIELAPEELVHIYYWLSEVLYWLSRFDDYLQLGEQALELLEPGSESVAMALVNHILSIGYLFAKGNQTKYFELRYRNAEFIQNLPYEEVLAPAYLCISDVYRENGEIGEAIKWLEILKEKAKTQGDYRAVGHVLSRSATILHVTGDLHRAVSERQKSMEISAKIGDLKHLCWCQEAIGVYLFDLGDLRNAAVILQKGYENAKALQSKRNMAQSQYYLGIINLCQGAHENAIAVFQGAVQLHKESGYSFGEFLATYLLGRAYLALGNCAAALERFHTCLALRGAESFRDPGVLWVDLITLSGIEAASDDAQWFQTYCRYFQEEHPEIDETPFVQWYLEPVDVGALRDLSPQGGAALFEDECRDSLPPGWTWYDTFDDCSFTIGNGVEIHAANGRGLRGNNVSAPRLLGSITGDFSFQTCCMPATNEKLVIGGLLLWFDKENYLRLDLGTYGENQIFFGGARQNQAVVVGRGCLPQDREQDATIDSPTQVYLRLERIGQRINAFCSADETSWFTVGATAFLGDNPIRVGLYAIGQIHRHIYHGAYPEGTAIRFLSTWVREAPFEAPGY